MSAGRLTKAWSILLACTAVILSATGGVQAEEEPVDLQTFRPQWHVGQKWVVETVTRQDQAGRTPMPERVAKPVRWQFEIESIESWEGKNCFRVRVTSLVPGRHPESTLWVDQQSMTLQRIRMQIPTAEGFSAIDEVYRAGSGQPFPAFTPVTVPPMELPVFLSGTKGNASFHYEALSGSGTAKALGDVGFGFSVEQSVEIPNPDEYTSLLSSDFAKSLERRPSIQVRLKSAKEQVRQVWRAGLPWPVFSDNGYARSLLVPDASLLRESQSK